MSDENIIISSQQIKKLTNIINKDNENDLNNKNQLTIRISIFGEQKCGKTALINCYLKKSFSSEKEDTIIDMYAKKIIINGFNVNLVISELSSDPSDLVILKQITYESHILFLCYSMEDDIGKLNQIMIDESLNNIIDLNESIPIFIVGCKFDLLKKEYIDPLKIYDNINEKTITGHDINEYLNFKRNETGKNICGYYITSSLLNINIDKLFNDAIKTVCFPYLQLYIDTQKKNEENKKKKKKKKNEEDDELYNIMKVNDNGCFIF